VFADQPGVSGLEAALRATLNNSPVVSGKRAGLAAKGYASDTSRAQRYPSVGAQIGADDDGRNPGNLRGRQPMWAFGRISSAIAYADADVQVGAADLLRAERDLISQTAEAYVRVLGSRERLRVAEDNVSALETMYRKIQRREQGRLASVADVRLALARLTQAKAQRERYSAELILSRNELHALTQVPVSADQPVDAAITRLPEDGQLELQALEASADMQLKRQQLGLAQADVERERTAPMPTIYLQADKSFDQPNGIDDDVRLGVVLEGNLEGMGFAAAGRNRQAGARQQAAIEEVNTARIEIIRTVQNLVASRDSQRKLIEVQTLSVQEVGATLASYQRQYEAGHKAWIDVLNLQRELTEQRLLQVQFENDWLVDTLRLAALTGSLDSQAGIGQGD
jgi:adhesin transport system outer membrane protein